jgi:drug/metabolite transporter (DMT)-like permease
MLFKDSIICLNLHLPLLLKSIIPGVLFAMLWASASAATKFGIISAEPLVLSNVRFLLAGTMMLVYAYGIEKSALPTRREWQQLVVFALLNTTLYLGLFVLAMKQVAAGIGSLSTATNPLIISVLSAFWVGRRVKYTEWMAIVLGMAGVGLATYPLLQNSFATLEGLLILAGSMLSYSIGTVYYSTCKWTLTRVALNGWQVFIAGFLLLPFTFIFHEKDSTFDLRFWLSVFWLIIPVSIIAVQLWLYLLKTEPDKASLWLFLCPVFGFIYASVLLREPLTWHTFAGTALVIAGLWIGRKK